MTISIPASYRLPGTYAEYNATRAQRGIEGLPAKLLVIGYKRDDDSSAADKTPIVVNLGEEDALFGRGSQLTLMVRTALLNNPYVPTYALPLAEPTGAAATGTITITATAAQASGNIRLYIAGQLVSVPVNNGDGAAQIATSVAAGINGSNTLPGTASASAGVVTFTTHQTGKFGNDIRITVNARSGEQLPGGVTVATADCKGGTGGIDAVDGTTVVNNLGEEWWTELVLPGTDAAFVEKITTELATREGASIQQDGIAYTCAVGTVATLSAFKNNSRRLSMMGMRASLVPTWQVAAAYGAVASVSASVSPASPLQYLPLVDLLAPGIADRFTESDRNILLGDGIATAIIDDSLTIRIEKAITKYTQNAAGVSDYSYSDVSDVNNLRYLRYSLVQRLGVLFPRKRLGNDGDPAIPGVVRPSDVRAAIIGIANAWLNAGLITDIDQFRDDLTVERDANNSDRLQISIQPTLIGQLRQMFVEIAFKL